MKKVKQMFRVTVARLAGPHFKIISHHKNIIHFGKVVKAFPKYFPTAQSLAYPPAEEAVKAQQQEAFQSDKLGLLNLGNYYFFALNILDFLHENSLIYSIPLIY